MLVLSRRPGESLLLGDPSKPIVVTIVDVRGDKVRIGIDAPREVPVRRDELLEKPKE